MKRGVILTIVLLLAIYSLAIWGCSKKIEGPPRVNQMPIVNFVNIPAEGASFLSDTTLFWYGSDVDGFIRYFRYCVVESTIVGNPDNYIAQNIDSMNWIVLEVDTTSTGTSAKVQMSADISDPVRTFVASYVFLQAIDNLGGQSDVVYRMFRKNNHFPETLIDPGRSLVVTDPVVNATSSEGALSGVRIAWSASDPIDYPRNPPPFEYLWTLYGPYDSATFAYMRTTHEKKVFVDNFGDYYLHGNHLQLLDRVDTTINNSVTPPETTLTNIYSYIKVDTNQVTELNPYGSFEEHLLGINPSLDSIIIPIDNWDDDLDTSVIHNYLSSPDYTVEQSDGWVWDESVELFDLFKKDSLIEPAEDTTRLKYFVFVCQSRDDSKVPDRVPGYKWLSCIEPKFERDVILIDVTGYEWTAYNFNWPHYPAFPYNPPTLEYPPGNPCDYDDNSFSVRDYYGGLAENCPDVEMDTDTPLEDICISIPSSGTVCMRYPQNGCTQDYFATYYLFPFPLIGINGVDKVTLRDILKHKVIMLVKDDVTSMLQTSSPEYRSIIKGLQAGMSIWTIARSPFNTGPKTFAYRSSPQVPYEYRTIFGIDSIIQSGWQAIIQLDVSYPDSSYRNETFVGAYPSDRTEIPEALTGMPVLDVNPQLLQERYLYDSIFAIPYRWYDSLPALPEVGHIQRQIYGAVPLFKYRSLYYEPDYIGDMPSWLNYETDFHAATTAVVYETQLYKASHFSFSLMAFDDVTSQQVYNKMMTWLLDQEYLKNGTMNPSARSHIDIQKLRDIEEELGELDRQGLLKSISGPDNIIY